MNFIEYAKKKIENYTKLGWVVEIVEEDNSVIKFNTIDMNKVARKHMFSENSINVELGSWTKGIPLIEDTQEEAVMLLAEKITPQKKTRKKKDQ